MIIENYNSALNDLLSGYEQVCYIVDRKVYDLYALSFEKCHLVDCSEADKSLETVMGMWDFFLSQGMTRRGVVVCIGGGVLTDMAGFASATYKRGMSYINIPTTLLAMIDASLGGKTGVNYHGLKNAIGVFADPVETLIWPGWLRSLPTEQVLSGFAEMLKTALIAPSTNDLWHRMLQYDLERMDIDELTPLIKECVAVKKRIVASDPKEEGFRKVLNFGHTFGHAFEEIQLADGKASDSKWLHGYAVLYGMIAELYLSVVQLDCPKEPLQHLTQLMLQAYGKPNCKCSDRERLIALMQQDKKNERAAQINCTLIRSVGSPLINQIITPDDANEALDYLFSL